MEYSKKYRWALTGFVVMLILNIGTLATIWMLRPPHHLAGLTDEQPRRVQRFLERELNLTAQQVEAFQQLRGEHIRETQSIISELQGDRRAYFELLNQPDSAIAKAGKDSLVQRIGMGHARLEESAYNHFQEIRKILNEEQQQRFDRVIDQMMQWRSRNRRQHGTMRGAGSRSGMF